MVEIKDGNSKILLLNIWRFKFVVYPPLSIGLSLASLGAAVRAEGLTKLSTIANKGFDNISSLYFTMNEGNWVKANVNASGETALPN